MSQGPKQFSNYRPYISRTFSSSRGSDPNRTAQQSPKAKKSATELFEEHRNAALAWANRPNTNKTNSVNLDTKREDTVDIESASDDFRIPRATGNGSGPFSPTTGKGFTPSTSLSSMSSTAYNIDTKSGPFSAGKGSPHHSQTSAGMKESPGRPSEHTQQTPHETSHTFKNTTTAASTTTHTHANLQEAMANNEFVSPSHASNTQNKHNPTHLQQQQLQLKPMERFSMLALLIITPIILYILEQIIFPSITTSKPDSSNTVTSLLSQMNYIDIIISVLLGVLLSYTYDRDATTTDTYILHIYKKLHAYIYLLEASFHFKEQNQKSQQKSNEFPLFTKFVVIIVVFAYLLRLAVGHTITTIQNFTQNYGSIILTILSCIIIICIIVVIIVYLWRQYNARLKIVKIVTAATKSLLFRHSQPVAIHALYEELQDLLNIHELDLCNTTTNTTTNTTSTTTTTTSTISPPSSHKATIIGDINYFSPDCTTNNAPLNTNTTATAPIHNTHNPTTSSSTTIHTPYNLNINIIKSNMKGYTLKQLWSEVQKEVEKDQRVQKNELFIHGRKQICWRILSGTANLKI